MKSLILLSVLFLGSAAFAEVETEVDSFGGNQALYEKAKALNPEVESQVIQNRFIERSNRFELGMGGSGVFGGDAYNNTNTADLSVNYHITPKWSVGVKYGYAFNTLTPEGKEAVQRAENDAVINPKDPKYLYPQVIYQKTELLGMLNWYPIVGKLSFGSWGVAHFDTYFMGGYGNMELSNGTSPATTLGLGLGFWGNSNATLRFEYRLQQYTAEYYDRTEDMLTSVASAQLGWLL